MSKPPPTYEQCLFRRGCIIVGVGWLACVGFLIALGEAYGGVVVLGLLGFGVLAIFGAAGALGAGR